MNLIDKYPDSESCSCEICISYCMQPGLWTVDEAEKAINAGLGDRMMLEIMTDLKFGILSPAYKKNESEFSQQIHSLNGCTFFKDNKCEIHNTENLPLECRFSHHSRHGQGNQCHEDIMSEWKTTEGQELIKKWIKLVERS